MSKISVIMPVYNAENTVGRAIDSLLSQDYEDWELILVDDGSLDDSLKVMREKTEKNDKVKIFSQSHVGAYAARNLGIGKAKGPYIFFADADDELLPDALSVMVGQMGETGCDLLTCGYISVNKKNQIRKEISAPKGKFTGTEIRKNYTKWTADSDCKVLGSCWNKCFRLDIIKAHGIAFPAILRNEEEVFIMRYLEHAEKIVNIPDLVYLVYPIVLADAFVRLPEDFCEQVDLFRKERLHYAKKWDCDTKDARSFIAGEYWGKMILGLKMVFDPALKKADKDEFKKRLAILINGLKETGDLPPSVSGSNLYKAMKMKLTPVVFELIKKSSRP